jgi:lipoate-protein ligase A
VSDVSDVLRVIDFGRVPPLRSQTLWHAVAFGVSAGQPATLSFARPSGPYVCLGYLRDAAEVDHEYCRAQGLPVYRRMVGGGPVYLDDRQLFFQIALPVGAVSPSRAAALRAMLEPAVAAFKAVGVDASLDDDGEICLGDRKICGHGAGQIEDAVVVCGNLIEAFDHERATQVLALPDPLQRTETLRLMRRYVTATPGDPDVFKVALTSAYSAALGRRAVPGEISAGEQEKAAELDLRFGGAKWLAGPRRTGPSGTGRRLVKVRAGIWTLTAQAADGARLVASVVNGTLERVVLTAPDLNGQAHEAERTLSGTTVASAAEVLSQLGDSGRQLAAALAGAEGRL